MDELISVMEEIRDLLRDIDYKLDEMKEATSELTNNVESIKGSGLYSIEDIHNKISDVEIAIDNLV